MLQHRKKHHPALRFVHWAMAVLILAGFFIGVRMSASAGPDYLALAAWHRPIGITVLALVMVRLAIRLNTPAAQLQQPLAGWQRAVARTTHALLYACMLAMPLLGWALVSAAGKPVVLLPGRLLPPLVAPDAGLHAVLRTAHSIVAYSFFALILAHLAAALHHRLVKRDGVFDAMTF